MVAEATRRKWFIDTETCGLYGMPVLLQYAIDDGPITLYSIWKHPISETMALIEEICEGIVIGFNLAFDWFQLVKLYTTFALADPDWIPEDHIDELAVLEEKARWNQDCLKPFAACDLMLHARKGPYQSLMAREDIRIRKVPIALADKLCEELEKRVEIDGIYFARRKDKHAPRWRKFDSKDQQGRVNPNFRDIILKFAPSGALKVLAEHLLKANQKKRILTFSEIEVDRKWRPKEYGWAPYALAVGKPGKWNDAWPKVIKHHIAHWHHHRIAREYAEDDIVYTRGLYHHPTFGAPEAGDDDSELACMVAAVRWKGFKVKTQAMKAMKAAARKKYEGVPMDPRKVKPFLEEVMTKQEIEAMQGSTKKVVLQKIAKSECDCVLEGEDKRKCGLCNGTGLHPSACRAKLILDARTAKKEEEIYDKILLAGRFHASFVVIGTLSSRMAGGDGLNAQGIKHTDEVRDCFGLADEGFVLCGGDFDSFEPNLADAFYNDPALRRDLMAGKKVHALFAEQMFPDKTYEEIMRSKGTEFDMYTMGKQGFLALMYGGDYMTLVKKQGIDEDVAKAAEEGFLNKYPKIRENRDRVKNMFCSMKQNQAGGKVTWAEPAEKIESLFGFPRYFTLENKICKALFDLAENIPKAWSDLKLKVTRRQDRGPQFVGGAVRSALFGAAFGIQGGAMRAAANHVIQSSGATIAKRLQRRIWDIQPHGVKPWRVIPMNVHDEVLCPTRPQYVDEVKRVVDETVESFRPQVPLISMTWDTALESWSKGMTESKARKIKQLAASGENDESICKIMGFKPKTELAEKVTSIVKGETWTHVAA